MAPVATINPSEVIADPGKLYFGAIGTTEPTAASDLATLPSAWREAGYTEEGSTFKYDVKSEMMEVAEELDPVKVAITGRSGTLGFAMAQASRRNAAIALNSAVSGSNDATTLSPPDPSGFVRCMILWVSNDENSARGVLFRRCLNTGGFELNRSKAPKKTLLPVEFSLEIPPSGTEPFMFLPNASGQI